MRIPLRQRIIQPDDTKKELSHLQRRHFIKKGLSLGALSLLTGCSLDDSPSVERALKAMSRFNDRVQAWLFNPNKLAPTYSVKDITTPFPFNAYYGIKDVDTVDEDDWRLELSGAIENKKPWSLAELRQLPQTTQITRLVCVEGWSAIGQWSGTPLREFLTRIGADLRAQYVGFKCFDDYFTSIDMATALHPQTILALEFGSQKLSPPFGAPLKVRIPTKLGFKNPKYVSAIFVTNTYPGGYWENQGYNWFSGS